MYEYLIVDLEERYNEENRLLPEADFLNKYGAGGWELCIREVNSYIFKRAKP